MKCRIRWCKREAIAEELCRWCLVRFYAAEPERLPIEVRLQAMGRPGILIPAPPEK